MARPFRKRISKGERRKLFATGFPSFERTSSGKLYQLKIIGESLGQRGKRQRRTNPLRNEAMKWCDTYFVGRYIPGTLFVFERSDDFVLALLRGNYFESVKTTMVG